MKSNLAYRVFADEAAAKASVYDYLDSRWKRAAPPTRSIRPLAAVEPCQRHHEAVDIGAGVI